LSNISKERNRLLGGAKEIGMESTGFGRRIADLPRSRKPIETSQGNLVSVVCQMKDNVGDECNPTVECTVISAEDSSEFIADSSPPVVLLSVETLNGGEHTC
jgi:hypothetical protein